MEVLLVTLVWNVSNTLAVYLAQGIDLKYLVLSCKLLVMLRFVWRVVHVAHDLVAF